MRLKKEPECKILKNGMIRCDAELSDGIKISQLYKASPKCLGIVNKHFDEIVKEQKIIQQQRNGNTMDKTKAFLKEKPLTCYNKYTFKEQGNIKVMEESSECVEGKKRWEKGIDGAIDLAKTLYPL